GLRQDARSAPPSLPHLEDVPSLKTTSIETDLAPRSRLVERRARALRSCRRGRASIDSPRAARSGTYRRRWKRCPREPRAELEARAEARSKARAHVATMERERRERIGEASPEGRRGRLRRASSRRTSSTTPPRSRSSSSRSPPRARRPLLEELP